MKIFMTAAIAALIPFAAAAHDGVAIVDPYARASNPKAGAAFMVIENHRKTECVLQGVSSDAAEKVELHSHNEENGVMRMAKIEGGIAIPPEDIHALARGGDHVMLMGLTAPLEDGQTIALSLDFGECGVEEVEVPVDNQRQPDHGGMTMDHGAEDGAMKHSH